MALALKLSKLGQVSVGANPMVGCVITKDDKIIAKAFHHKYGQEHAEINALNQINHKAKNCKLYVTLEPCSHHGNCLLYTSPSPRDLSTSRMKSSA